MTVGKKSPAKKPGARRGRRLAIRIDEPLFLAAFERARQYGGLSAVIRAMLRAFVRGEGTFTLQDLSEENTPVNPGRPPGAPRKGKP